MSVTQLDLFAGAGNHSDYTAARTVDRPGLVAPELDDDALIAAIPAASLGDCRNPAAEAGRRRLVGAIAALEALCRRFQGFGQRTCDFGTDSRVRGACSDRWERGGARGKADYR